MACTTSLWESKQDAPYDVSVGARRLAARRDGRQRQGVPAVRRAGDTRAGHQRARAARHDPRPPEGPDAACHGESRAARRDVKCPRQPRHLQLGSEGRQGRVASWGTLSWRVSTPQGTKVELFTRAGNTRTPDETWSDWAGPYPDAYGLGHHQPQGPVPPMARRAFRRGRDAGAHVGLRRVPATEPPAPGRIDHGASRRRRVSEAVLDRRDGDCRVRRGAAGAPPGEPGRRRRGADGRADAGTPHLPARAADAGVEGRGRER